MEKPGWLLDLEHEMEIDGRRLRRWSQREIDALKDVMNRNGFKAVSNCIGSLEFDKVELENKLERK